MVIGEVYTLLVDGLIARGLICIKINFHRTNSGNNPWKIAGTSMTKINLEGEEWTTNA